MNRQLTHIFYLLLFILCEPIFAQVNPAFTITYQNPNCAPAVVSFTDATTGVGPFTYQWNFGVSGGVNSTLQNPSTTYTNCGSYTVTETVSNGSATNVIVHTVVINCLPTASFTQNVSTGCPPLSVQFTNTSSAGSGILSNYTWDFGDGSPPSNVANPTHVYTSTGCKNVTLIITNSFGCTDLIVVNNAVCVNTPPVAAFTSNPSPATSCSSPFVVSFNANGSTGQNPLNYQWTFGGGVPATSTAVNPTVTFNSFGFHAVTLIVTDANGCMDTISLPQYVFIGNFSANFSINSLSGCVPFTANVTATTIGAASLNWTAAGGAPNVASGQSASFTYNSAGNYQICLTANSGTGCVASQCTTVVVHNTPNANFSSTGNNPNACQAPMTVNFQNTSTGGGTHQWSFSGGTPATSAANNPNVTFQNCGNFDVQLIETNAFGCADTFLQPSYVNINCPYDTFTVSDTAGCIPLTVQFNSSLSLGNPVQWKWNFGTTGNPNAVQSTLQNPSFTFNTPGCYNVRLVTFNAAGCTDTALYQSFVCVGTPPVASFTNIPIVACATIPISFTNTSTGIFPYTTYHWIFGDGGTSNQMNPNYQYSDTGWFNVSLTVCNYGCCATFVLDSAVHILPPVPVAIPSFNCSNPYFYSFNGSSSIGADTYLWTFQNGNPATSTNANQNVTYTSSGNYNVTLAVHNNQTGCTNTTSFIVRPRNMLVSFITPPFGCAPYVYNFQNTTIDATSYRWRITNSSGTQIFQSTSIVPPPFTFTTAGVYTIRLIGIDINNCRDTVFNSITIYDMSPNFTFLPNNVCAPVPVTFQDISNYMNTLPASWFWNFGDSASGAANTSTLQNPTHTYVHGGNYTVSLTVTDIHGCVYNYTLTGGVHLNGPHADFFAANTSICPGGVSCFTNISTGNGLSYHWTFGTPPNSTATNPCHTYIPPGNYSVQLVATDNQGCNDTMVKPNYITAINLQANFMPDTNSTLCPPLPVNFTNLTTGGGTGTTTYLWDFGDGTSSISTNPFHIYNAPGAYNVTLIATSSFGCSDTISFPNLITIGGPSATIISSPNIGCAPLTNCFVAVLQGSGITLTWNFGDGNVILNGPDSICHVYTSSGIFYPQVILQNGNGCTQALAFDSIIVASPTAGFFVNDTSLCSAGLVSFTDTSWSPVGISTYHWNFGDPASGANNISAVANPTHFYSLVGNYVIQLIAMSTVGCFDTAYTTVHITAPPISSFTISNFTPCQGTSVNFTNTTTSAFAIANHSWNFGDPASGVLNSSNTLNASHLYLTPGNYIITLIETDINGCADTITNSLNVIANPVAVILSNPPAICIGDSAQFLGSGGVTFAWSPGSSLNDSTISNPIAHPLISTLYTLTITNAIGCPDTAQYNLVVHLLPTIIASPDDSVCSNNSIGISAIGGVSYVWTPAGTLTNANSSSPTATPISTTTYFVTGTDINGCKNNDSVVIHLLNNPLVSAGPDDTICVGASIQLNGIGGLTYSWIPNLFLTNNLISNPVSTPTSSIQYTMTATDINGCFSMDSLFILVHPLPNSNAGSDQTICLGNTTTLSGSGGSTYLWTPSTYLSSDTIPNPICTPLDSVQYNLHVTTQFGCVKDTFVNIFVVFPIVPLITADTAVCIGETIQLFAGGGVSYHWWPTAGLSNVNIPDPLANPVNTTTYFVSISDNICFIDTASVIVTVNQLPTVDAGKDFTILAGQTANIDASSSGNVFYSWSPVDNLDCTSCEDPDATPPASITYFVTAIDTNGCTATDSMHIIVVCHDDVIYIANAFTPNGDNVDDKFIIRSAGLKKLNSLRVFNRWGQLVFETADVNEGWDGTFKGQPLAPGVFVWYLDAVCSNDGNVKIQGNVTLIK